MCGRFTLRTPASQLIELFQVPSFPELAPRYNIAPTQMVICVRAASDHVTSREAVAMRWGLIPFWAKDMAIGNQLINARSETVAEKPAFRAALKKRRCLIPADGFFEWQKLSTGKKQPWLIQRLGEQPFAMAGLWETWTTRSGYAAAGGRSSDFGWTGEGGEDSGALSKVVMSCTILTTQASQDMLPLHDRMPVILPDHLWSAWLSPDVSKEQLAQMMAPLPAGSLTHTCVSMQVNRPSPDNPGCIAAVEPPEPLGITGT